MRRSTKKTETHSSAWWTIIEKNYICTSKEHLAWAKTWLNRAVRRQGKEECKNDRDE